MTEPTEEIKTEDAPQTQKKRYSSSNRTTEQERERYYRCRYKNEEYQLKKKVYAYTRLYPFLSPLQIDEFKKNGKFYRKIQELDPEIVMNILEYNLKIASSESESASD